ncbi:MAG TPA: hypothetical protein VKY73_00380 [Polyangiaceae bacterium]|nr:hypothetical protein [Polyangiaceae bacterium]
MTRFALAIVAGFGVIASCGDSDDRPPPPVPSGGRGGSTALSGGTGALPESGGTAGMGDSSGGEGGAAGDGSTGGAPAEAGAGGEPAASAGAGGEPDTGPAFPCPSDDATEPPSLTSLCDVTLALGEGEKLRVEAGNADSFIGVTPDELTLVWSSLGSSSIQYFVADRASADEDFDVPLSIATDGVVVGLSPDGLRVVVNALDGSGYTELVRAERGLPFDSVAVEAFEVLNEAAADHGWRYVGGAISGDDRLFVYQVFTGEDDQYPVHISTRDGVDEPWPLGQPQEICELEAHEALVKRPVALSADGLTLFFYDPDRGVARAAFRQELDEPYEWFVNLGAFGTVMPNEDCTRLYYTTAVHASPIHVASAE